MGLIPIIIMKKNKEKLTTRKGVGSIVCITTVIMFCMNIFGGYTIPWWLVFLPLYIPILFTIAILLSCIGLYLMFDIDLDDYKPF